MSAEAPIVIVGAGLAGLIAAHTFPRAKVLEAAPEPTRNHRALLRFRSDAVARATGVEFRKVLVRKGIWENGGFTRPSIRAANLYERKVTGAARLRGERSIWNVEAAERFIAPDDLQEQLRAAVGSRIEYGAAASFPELFSAGARVVNTSPLPGVLESLGLGAFRVAHDFRRAPIRVRRFVIEDADAFQTVYFPDPELAVYRASITGSLLIVEEVTPQAAGSSIDSQAATETSNYAVQQAFGLGGAHVTPLDDTQQRYGKIEPIADAARKQLLFELTHRYRIYSLGRFATWRNILLDDVVSDIGAIKRLMRAGDYDTRRAAA